MEREGRDSWVGVEQRREGGLGGIGGCKVGEGWVFQFFFNFLIFNFF